MAFSARFMLVWLAISITALLAPTPAAALGCAQQQHCTYIPIIQSPGTTLGYVLNSVVLPAQRTSFAIDLNGDGKVDNQFGAIVGAFAQLGFAFQANEDRAIETGKLVHLLRLQAKDASLADDPAAKATLFAGTPTFPAAPDFSGTGAFTIDRALREGRFLGPLRAADYSSINPVTTSAPVSLTLQLGIFSDGELLALPIQGAHIAFRASSTQLIAGQLQGSIRDSDVRGLLIPALARELTHTIQADPTSSASKSLEALFDVGGCTDADNTPAQAHDLVIATCELANNSLAQSIFAPDVQIYDSAGNYAPNPTNAAKDSLSFAAGFTAVRGQF